MIKATGPTAATGHELEHRVTQEQQVMHGDPGHGVCTQIVN